MAARDKLTTIPPNAANTVWLPFCSDENGKLIHSKLRGPNPRNREIWEAHKVFLRSQRDVAKHYNLSHTRVGQIVRQVDKWYAATDGGRNGTSRARLIVAETVHQARLDHLFGQALAGWAKSGEVARQVKFIDVTGKPERKETIHKTRDGDRRFLDSGLKIQNSLFAFQNARDPQGMTAEEKRADAEKVLVEVGMPNAPAVKKDRDTERKDGGMDEKKEVVVEEVSATAAVQVEVQEPAQEVAANGTAEVIVVPTQREPVKEESVEVSPPKKEKKPKPPQVQGRPAPGYYYRPKPANWRQLENVLLNDKPKEQPQQRVQTIQMACPIVVGRTV